MDCQPLKKSRPRKFGSSMTPPLIVLRHPAPATCRLLFVPQVHPSTKELVGSPSATEHFLVYGKAFKKAWYVCDSICDGMERVVRVVFGRHGCLLYLSECV